MPPKKDPPPSREGLVALTTHITPELRKALRLKAAEDDTSIQAIVTDALERAVGMKRKPSAG
jgi:predicted HicB family RNase H-like nuclease